MNDFFTSPLLLWLSLLVIGIFVFVVATDVIKSWLRARLAEIEISPWRLLRLKLRGVDLNVAVTVAAMLKRSGFRVPVTDLAAAMRRQANVHKIALAMIEGRKRRLDFTFKELVELDLTGRLEARLARREG